MNHTLVFLCVFLMVASSAIGAYSLALKKRQEKSPLTDNLFYALVSVFVFGSGALITLISVY